MNAALARLLTRLYPRAWRQRYGAEFQAFLETGRGDFRAVTNVTRSALSEHIFPLRGLTMNRLPSSLGMILCAYLAVIAAGINFYATVDDSPIATAMQGTLGLSIAWNLVAIGSIAALVGAIGMLAPLAAGALRFVIFQKRRDILIRLLVGPVAAALLAAWLIGGTFALGGHWAPAPWAIAGDWTAAANWPPLQVRWVAGSLTAAMAIVVVVAASITGYQAITRTRFDALRFTVLDRLVSIHPLRLARIPGMLTSAAIAVMTMGVLAWGLMANMQARADFHAYFGPMHTTAFASWIASACVFAAASVAALRASVPLLKPLTE